MFAKGRVRALLAPFLVCVFVPAALASDPLVQPISQTREVRGSANASDTSGDASENGADAAVDFSPFNAGASGDASVPNALGSGGGTQNSEILAFSIDCVGTSFSNAESYDFDGFADASGSSQCLVVFDVSVESRYVLFGDIAAFDNGTSSARLTGAGGDLFSTFAAGPSDIIPVDDSGILLPGQYTFEVEGSGSSFAGAFGFDFSSTEFGVTLSLSADGPGGRIPNGATGAPLTVEKPIVAGEVRTQWNASCRAEDVDYAVYEGQLGDAGSLQPVQCSTGGQLDLQFTSSFTNAFFLVVPNDGATEGSYGEDSSGLERAPSGSACFVQNLGRPICP